MAEKYGSLLKGTRSNTLERERSLTSLGRAMKQNEIQEKKKKPILFVIGFLEYY